MPIRNLLFDLDGTLTDPAEGITRCYQFALEGLGRTPLQRAELLRFIGPPMRENFAAILGADDRELVERAVALYRERFARVGLYENEVYPGVREMLLALSVADFRLFVATSKVTEYSALILEHFRLAGFFVSVHGATPDGALDDKADLVARLLRVEEIDAAESVMIGDREHDIRAASRNGVRSVGVTYGYGSRAELDAAGANFICDTPSEVATVLLAQR
jgi:phosphoglycolate phosphatase